VRSRSERILRSRSKVRARLSHLTAASVHLLSSRVWSGSVAYSGILLNLLLMLKCMLAQEWCFGSSLWFPAEVGHKDTLFSQHDRSWIAFMFSGTATFISKSSITESFLDLHTCLCLLELYCPLKKWLTLNTESIELTKILNTREFILSGTVTIWKQN